MIIAAVVVIVLLVFWAISIHNNIIRASNRCDNAWAAIDTQLQRRNDLIPNLVNTVKGYATHESKTFEAVTSARAAVANARTPEEKMQASGTLSNALTNLFAVVENYPELKANQNFLELQAELTDTENRLSYARLSYNDVVMNYNNIIAVFPNDKFFHKSMQTGPLRILGFHRGKLLRPRRRVVDKLGEKHSPDGCERTPSPI